MADRRKTNRRAREEEDQILRISLTVVVVLFVAAGIFVGIRLLNPREDVTAGREKLEELTSVDVAEVESAILVVDRDTDDTAEDEPAESASEEEQAAQDTAQDTTRDTTQESLPEE